MGRDQAHVVLYEDNSRRNVNALIAALKGLQVRLMQLPARGEMRQSGETGGSLTSPQWRVCG